MSSSTSNNDSSNSSGSANKKSSIICTEVFEGDIKFTEKDIREYSLKIGIDFEKEKHLLHIAEEGLLRQLPPEWKPCWDDNVKDFYYFNFKTGETQWDHPLDTLYRDKVIEARKEGSKKSMESNRLNPLPPLSKLKPLGSNPLPPLKKSSSSPSSKKSGISPLKTKNVLGSKKDRDIKASSEEKEDASEEIIRSLDTASSTSSVNSNIRGILKSNERSTKNGNWRKELIDKDERRIIFDLEKNIEFSPNIKLSPPEINCVSQESSNEDDEKGEDTGDGREKDFMERHRLFDIEDLQLDGGEKDKKQSSSSSSELLEKEDSDASSKQILAKNLNKVPKPSPRENRLSAKTFEPVIKNFGSDVSFSLEKDDVEPQKEAEKVNDVLKTIKFPSETLEKLAEQRQTAMRQTPEEKSQVRGEFFNVGEPLTKKVELKKSLMNSSMEEHSSSSSTNPVPKVRKRSMMKRNTDNEEALIEEMRKNFALSLEKEKGEAEEALRHEFEKNMSELRKDLEIQKLQKERELQESFEREIQSVKEVFAEELNQQKSKLLSSFQEELSRETLKIGEKRDEEARHLKESFCNNLQKEIATYRSVLKAEFEEERKNLEIEMKQRLEADLSVLKDKIIQEQRPNPLPLRSNWVNEEHSSFQHEKPKSFQNKLHHHIDEMKGRLKNDFARQVQDLESEIEYLRSKMTLDDHGIGAFDDVDFMDPGNSSSMEEDEEDINAVIQKRANKLKKRGTYRSTPNLDQCSDIDSAVYESSSHIDLNRSLQNLQQRVVSLEKCLVPFSQPAFPMRSNAKILTAQRHLGIGGPLITTTSTLGEKPLGQGYAGAWTIEEQLYKSKMWLKQRNQKFPFTNAFKERPF